MIDASDHFKPFGTDAGFRGLERRQTALERILPSAKRIVLLLLLGALFLIYYLLDGLQRTIDTL